MAESLMCNCGELSAEQLLEWTPAQINAGQCPFCGHFRLDNPRRIPPAPQVVTGESVEIFILPVETFERVIEGKGSMQTRTYYFDVKPALASGTMEGIAIEVQEAYCLPDHREPGWLYPDAIAKSLGSSLVEQSPTECEMLAPGIFGSGDFQVPLVVIQAVSTIGPVVAGALGVWLKGRLGRKVKLKFHGVQIEANSVDELPKIMDFINQYSNTQVSKFASEKESAVPKAPRKRAAKSVG